MCSLADRVREANDQMWSPDAEFDATPSLLIAEPVVADEYASIDGRVWVRVYLDGSALDQNGHTWHRVPGMARAMAQAAIGAGLPLAA